MKSAWLLGGMLMVPAPALSGQCILPPPDTEIAGQAAPAVSGVITHVRGSHLEIKPETGWRRTFHITRTAAFYTVYGGDVQRQQLKPGQYAYLWLENCASSANSNQVVLVKICSLDNARC